MKRRGCDEKNQARRLAALESELRLCRELLATTVDGVLLVDSDLVVRWANEAAAAFAGLGAEELTGMTCHQLWGGGPCSGCPCRGGEGSQEEKGATAAVLRTGRRQCRAVADAVAGGIVGAVTIRGANDWPLEREGAEVRADFPAENFPVPCHSLDDQARLLVVNQAWLALLGYRREEVVGQPFARFVCPARRGHFEKTFAFLLQRGEISGVETELCRKDGEAVSLLVDGRGIFDDDGSFRRTTCILTPRSPEWRPGAAAGLLPICSSCKKIRDKGGLWHNLEYYFNIHTRIEFSHGICPDCLPRLYPEFYR
jgi:PAS domain S-box-containing protein